MSNGGSINIIGYIFARFATKIYIKWVIGFCFKYSITILVLALDIMPVLHYLEKAHFFRESLGNLKQNILLETKLCGDYPPHVFAKFYPVE